MTNFPDISHYQGGINFRALKASGVDTVILKATQGLSAVDTAYAQYVAGAFAEGIKQVGHYHFADVTANPTAQARHFLATVGTVSPGDALILDIEQGSGTLGAVRNRAWVTAFLAPLRAAVGGDKLRVWIYTGVDYWQTDLGSWVQDAPTWIAHPGSFVAPRGTHPFLWQNGTARFAGIAAPADSNEPRVGNLAPYFGTAARLSAHAAHVAHVARVWAAHLAHLAHLRHIGKP